LECAFAQQDRDVAAGLVQDCLSAEAGALAEARVLDAGAVEELEQLGGLVSVALAHARTSAVVGSCLPVSIFETFGCLHPSPRRCAKPAPVSPVARRS